MNRTFSLVMAFLLLLVTACTPNAPLLTEAMKKEYTSFEASSTITFDTNLQVEDEQIQSLLQVLKSGIHARTQMKDEKHAHLVISLQDPSPIMGTDLWTSETTPGLDLYVNGNDVYLKSTADAKFLGVKGEESAEKLDQEFQNLSKKLLEDFLKNSTFSFKQVEKVGEETIKLPDGSEQQATHVRLTLDLEELVDFAAYVADYVSKSKEWEEAVKSFFATVDPEAQAEEASVKDSLKELVKELQAVNVEELKKQGWGATIVLNTWINADKFIVQSEAAYSVQVPASFLAEQELVPLNGQKDVTFTLKTAEKYWNHNKDVTFSYPASDQIIMTDALEQNPELVESFGEDGLIGQLAAMMNQKVELEPAFTDVPEDHWAFGPISVLKDAGIVNGYENNEFKPNKPITRSEFIVMAVKALDVEQKSMNLGFKDKKDVPAWASPYWQAAIQAGLIKGYGDGTLRPNQNISRAEMVTILVRGTGTPLANGKSLTFVDAKEIPAWAAPYVKTAVANGIVQGTPDNRFHPYKNASRAEVAKVLFSILFEIPETEETGTN